MESKNHQEVTSNKNRYVENASSGSVFKLEKWREFDWLKWPEIGAWRSFKNGKGLVGWLFFLPRIPLMVLIKIYQLTISPDHGLIKGMFPHGYCRFHPSCSTYGYESVKKYGLIRGIPRMIWRVIRCNPWNDGGMDLP